MLEGKALSALHTLLVSTLGEHDSPWLCREQSPIWLSGSALQPVFQLLLSRTPRCTQIHLIIPCLPWLLHQSHSPRDDSAKCLAQGHRSVALLGWGCGCILLSRTILLRGKGDWHKSDATTGYFFLEGKRDVIKQLPVCQAGQEILPWTSCPLSICPRPDDRGKSCCPGLQCSRL